MRIKSSLTGRRVKQDPAFAVTMQYANMLGTASKIASGIYRRLDTAQKVKDLYRKLTGEAMRMLKKGDATEQVAEKLAADYLPKPMTRQKQVRKIKSDTTTQNFADALLTYIFAAEETSTTNLYVMTKEAAPT